MGDLIYKICKLSKTERQSIVLSKILIQHKPLRVDLSFDGTIDIETLNYLVTLSNDLMISYRTFGKNELYLLGNLLLLHKQKVESSWHQFILNIKLDE